MAVVFVGAGPVDQLATVGEPMMGSWLIVAIASRPMRALMVGRVAPSDGICATVIPSGSGGFGYGGSIDHRRGPALGGAGLALLYTLVNPLTAALIGYAVVYTGFLKRATSQNIVIGGLAGAAPPLLGWTAVTGRIEALPVLLVMIVFVWRPPHFWPLAIHRVEDYRRAGVPMLPAALNSAE